jgi:hypothetical protein
MHCGVLVGRATNSAEVTGKQSVSTRYVSTRYVSTPGDRDEGYREDHLRRRDAKGSWSVM